MKRFKAATTGVLAATAMLAAMGATGCAGDLTGAVGVIDELIGYGTDTVGGRTLGGYPIYPDYLTNPYPTVDIWGGTSTYPPIDPWGGFEPNEPNSIYVWIDDTSWGDPNYYYEDPNFGWYDDPNFGWYY